MSDDKMPDLHTSREVCKAIKASASTLKRYRDDGKIEFIKLGRNVRFTTQAVRNFVDGKARQNEDYS